MSDTAFDPAKHLTKVSGRDYLEVKWRLVWLRSVDPGARITTELVKHTDVHAIVRAEVTMTTGAVASGYGSEGTDDFGDYLEKAETKAIGRALAALGFGTQFCADHDFGADRQRVVDSPVDIRSSRGSQQNGLQHHGGTTAHAAQRSNAALGGDAITEKQRNFLWRKANEAGWTEAEVHNDIMGRYGVESVNDLTKRQASEFIDALGG